MAQTDNALPVQLAHIVPATAAEGPGVRFAIWFQGCPLRCVGCCNPEQLPFAGGQSSTVGTVLEQLQAARQKNDLEGITLLGGEPTAQAVAATAIARAAQELGLTVLLFSGFTWAELQAQTDPHVHALLAATDLLVAGPYVREEPETQRRWIGSANQELIALSPRGAVDDPRWQQPNTLEIRWQNGELTVNGFPAAAAQSFWKKPFWKRAPTVPLQS